MTTFEAWIQARIRATNGLGYRRGRKGRPRTKPFDVTTVRRHVRKAKRAA